MYKFKIGDRVKVRYKRSTSSQFLDGRIGRIIDWHNCPGKNYGTLDIEKELREPGGVWEDELIPLDRMDLSHIKKYKVAEFLESLK